MATGPPTSRRSRWSPRASGNRRERRRQGGGDGRGEGRVSDHEASTRERLELNGHQQFRRNRDRPRLLEEDPELEPRRGHQAGDDQLPDPEAREGRALLRAHLRADQGLGVLLRQVQAGPLQGDRLRALRRRGDALEGSPRAHGPHRSRRARLPHLVLQGRSVADRLPDRHGSEGAREGPLLRRLDHHLDRRGGAYEGPRQAREGGQEGHRRLRRRARAAHPGAARVARAPRGVARGRGRPVDLRRRRQSLGRGPRHQPAQARRRRAHEAASRRRRRRSRRRSPTPRPISTTRSSAWRRSGGSSPR